MSEEQKSRETASQNEGSQEGTEPKRTDVERVEEAAQAIVRAIETGSDRFWEAQVEAQQKAAKPKNPLVNTMLFVASTWVVFFAIISALTFLAGWALYEVRPLHALERIGREQQQADAKEYLGAFHVDLGNALLNVGRVEQAQAEFEKALEIDPLNTDAEQGRTECALFLSVRKIQSPNADAAIIDEKLTALINAQEDALKPKNGLLGPIMNNSKDQTETNQRLSQLYAFQGDYFYYYDPTAAVDAYKAAIQFNDQNAVAYSGLSTNYYERGDFDLAEKYARLAWSTAKWDSLLETNYADALLANGHYVKAIRRYQDVITWDRHYIWAYHNAATTFRLLGYLDYSKMYYEELIRVLQDEQITSLARNQGGYSFTIGTAHDNSGYGGWSAVYLRKPSEQLYYAHHGLALTLHLMGRTEEAETHVHIANDLQTNSSMEADVKQLMQYDIDKLQEEKKQLSDTADHFREEFL